MPEIVLVSRIHSGFGKAQIKVWVSIFKIKIVSHAYEEFPLHFRVLELEVCSVEAEPFATIVQ